MSEQATPAAEGDVSEVELRSARKDGREIVRMRHVALGDGFLVECEVYPVGGLRVEPLRPGPYHFATREESGTFVRETVAILEHLGCEVT